MVISKVGKGGLSELINDLMNDLMATVFVEQPLALPRSAKYNIPMIYTQR